MRISIVILAVLGLVCGKPFQNGSPKDDVNEFIALVPTDKVLEITLDYLHNDKEVQEYVANLQSEEFPKIHKIVEYLKEYKDCLKYIDDHGVDVYGIVNEIHDILGYPPFQPNNSTRTGVGIQGLKDDVIAAFPLNEMKALFYKKMESNEFYKALVTAIREHDVTNLVDTVRTSPGWQELRERLQEKGVNVDLFMELFKEFYRLARRATRRLQDEMNDFMALNPTEKMLEIVLDYLHNDKEVQEFIAYVQSEEFPKIHTAVQYLQQYKNYLKYIDDNGVDVYGIVNEIHDILGYPPFQPTNSTRTGAGFHGLKDDVIAAFPIKELKALFDKKMETNKFYKALGRAIQTPYFRKFVDIVRTPPEWKELHKSLQEKGVDVDLYMELIKEFYHLARRVGDTATRRLQDNLKEFMALNPTEKIFEIVLDYLHNDEEVQEYVAYVQSEEFPKIHTAVEYLKQYKNCVKYIDDHGVDVYGIVNKIHDILGYPPFQPTNRTRTGVGMKGLKNDVIAALPLKDMKELVYKKMETNEIYKALVTATQTPEFKNFVYTVRAWPYWQEFYNIVREIDVDMEHYTELFKELYRLVQRASRRLQDDLNDFMALNPTEKILEILLDYLYNDKEVQEYVAYVQSEEFPLIHAVVEYLKKYKDYLKYVDDNGVDVYGIVNEIHDRLGYPPFQPTNSTRTGVGMKGLKDDVIAALPLDEIMELFYEKMETNEFYKALVTAIRTHDFMYFVDTVRTWPGWQELRENLREKGVDVYRYIELIKECYRLAQRATRRLQDEMKDFMALNPTEKMLEIVLDYLHNDEEVQEFIAEVQKYIVYMQSEEFPKIHTVVEYLKQHKNYMKYIDDHGVDVYGIVNKIHDMLGYPPFQPTNTTRTGAGFQGLKDDLIAALPLDETKALVYKKVQSSQMYKALVPAIQTPEYKKFVDTLRAWPEWQEVLRILRERGVDEDYIKGQLRALYGLFHR